MSLQSYVEHRGGASFGLDAHQAAWSVVGLWVRDRDKLLPVDWITTRYGNTELKPLLSAMVQEANQGKCTEFSQSGRQLSSAELRPVLQGGLEYAEES
jgi:hypothetical protein